MQNTPSNRYSSLIPLLILFAVLAVLIVLFNDQLVGKGVDIWVLHASNALLFVVSSLATGWMAKSLRQSGGQSLLKAIYGGFMIRFFLLAGTAFIYILYKRKEVNLPGLVGASIFYILYLWIEIRSLRPVIKSGRQNA